MTRKQKKNLKKIIIAIAIYAILLIADYVLGHAFGGVFPSGLASVIPDERFGWTLPFVLFFALYLFVGFKVLKKSAINIKNGQLLDENFLMSVASLGAFALGIYTGISTGSPVGFDEAAAVMIFYMLGEWFESYAVGKSRKSIGALMDIRPDSADVLRKNGEIETVDPSSVNVGEIIVVRPGEKIPLDGVIVSGKSNIDARALTGESAPIPVDVDSAVMSGTVNLDGVIKIKTTKSYGDSTATKILELVENASSKKSRPENFISKFSRIYTPVVVATAILLAVLPPVISGLIGSGWNFYDWIYRALSFLVVSCPCALVISVPLTFFAGIGGASGNGILIKGSSYIERLQKANVFVFDKTGTLTKGNFAIAEVYPEERREEILLLAGIAESNSDHPIAKSVNAAVGEVNSSGYEFTEFAGRGIRAFGKHEILCGNEKLMRENGIEFEPAYVAGTVVYVAEDGKFKGYIVIADEIKPNAKDVIGLLQDGGARTVMLTGDTPAIARNVARKLGISEYKASLLPGDKAEEVERLIEKKRDKDVLCYVGDGINDAPVLMRADVGVSMGGVGSDAAIEASDVVLMHDDLGGLLTAKRIAEKTIRIVYENIVFAIFVKIAILILSALGITNMWVAVFGDVGVAALAIINAMRALSVKKNRKKIKRTVDNRN